MSTLYTRHEALFVSQAWKSERDPLIGQMANVRRGCQSDPPCSPNCATYHMARGLEEETSIGTKNSTKIRLKPRRQCVSASRHCITANPSVQHRQARELALPWRVYLNATAPPWCYVPTYGVLEAGMSRSDGNNDVIREEVSFFSDESQGERPALQERVLLARCTRTTRLPPLQVRSSVEIWKRAPAVTHLRAFGRVAVRPLDM